MLVGFKVSFSVLMAVRGGRAVDSPFILPSIRTGPLFVLYISWL